MAALFSVAEARAYDRAQLANVTDYPTVDIEAKELEIRQWLAEACGVDFVPTSHTETHDGDASDYLMLGWPKVTSIDSLTIDGTAIGSGYLSLTDYSIGMAVSEAGLLTWRGGTFTAGWGNVLITYTAGYAAVPYLIKRAALRVCVLEMPTSNVPFAADSYDGGGMTVNFANGDGFGGRWHRDPDVMKAVRMYDYSLPGVV